MLRHIAYASLSRPPLKPNVLSDILDVSVRNNERDGITGVLMYHDDLFFQVLEGEDRAVEKCYIRISIDPRHYAIVKSLDEAVEVRSFSDWLMGYVGPEEIGEHTDGALLSLADLKAFDFSDSGKRGLALELAKQVFKNFKER